MPKINMLTFNIKNTKFSVKDSLGAYGIPAELALTDSLALEPNFSEQEIFGDGDLLTVLVNDKGYTGELVVISKEDAFEKALGFKMDVVNGIADAQQLGRPEVAIYYETENQIAGVLKVYKAWLLSCFVSRAAETVTQRKDAPAIPTYTYALKISGDVLKDNAGTATYIDTNGNTIRITRVVSRPTDTGYATFGDTVPAPKKTAA